VRSGHLLSILEKGLIYAKIEAHVNFVMVLSFRVNTWNAINLFIFWNRIPARWLKK